jgi:hypothetical protein
VVTLELVVEEHLVVMFMMVLQNHGSLLLEAAVEEEVDHGMWVQILEVMVEIGKQYLVM